MVLEELNFNISTLGGCGSLKRTDFFNNFYFGKVWWSGKN